MKFLIRESQELDLQKRDFLQRQKLKSSSRYSSIARNNGMDNMEDKNESQIVINETL